MLTKQINVTMDDKNTFISIDEILTEKQIKNSVAWVMTMSELFPNKIKRIATTKDNKAKLNTVILKSFADEFLARYNGTIGISTYDFCAKYGVAPLVVQNACNQIYKHKPYVAYLPAGRHARIIDEQDFINLTGITPKQPFDSPDWITAEQLAHTLFANEEATDEIKLAQTTDILMEFAKSYPDTVAGNRYQTTTEYIKRFDPLRLKKSAFELFKQIMYMKIQLTCTANKCGRHKKAPARTVQYIAVAPSKKELRKLKESIEHERLVAELRAKKAKRDSRLELQAQKKEIQNKERAKIKSRYADMLTAEEVWHACTFIERITKTGMADKIIEFAAIHPDAVQTVPAPIYVPQKKPHDITVLKKAYLTEFLEFIQKTIVWNGFEENLHQPPVNPDAPDYTVDFSLRPVSDSDKNEIAWRLASKDIIDVNAANDAIFKMMDSIHNRRKKYALKKAIQRRS